MCFVLVPAKSNIEEIFGETYLSLTNLKDIDYCFLAKSIEIMNARYSAKHTAEVTYQFVIITARHITQIWVAANETRFFKKN